MQANLFKKSAVLVEQNSVEETLFRDILTANGFEVYAAKSLMDALVKLQEKENDLLVLDMEIAGQSFIEKFLQNIRREKICALTVIIGLSIYWQDEQKKVGELLDACLVKPFPIDTFIKVIFESIEKRACGCEVSESENF